jgi:hypothetical protein
MSLNIKKALLFAVWVIGVCKGKKVKMLGVYGYWGNPRSHLCYAQTMRTIEVTLII